MVGMMTTVSIKRVSRETRSPMLSYSLFPWGENDFWGDCFPILAASSLYFLRIVMIVCPTPVPKVLSHIDGNLAGGDGNYVSWFSWASAVRDWW